jgi:hypothetical protein
MIASYKFWNKFKFESSLDFKGVQTFLEKSDKFFKISSSKTEYTIFLQLGLYCSKQCISTVEATVDIL